MFLCDAVSLSLKELRSQPQNPQGLDAPPDPPGVRSASKCQVISSFLHELWSSPRLRSELTKIRLQILVVSCSNLIVIDVIVLQVSAQFVTDIDQPCEIFDLLHCPQGFDFGLSILSTLLCFAGRHVPHRLNGEEKFRCEALCRCLADCFSKCAYTVGPSIGIGERNATSNTIHAPSQPPNYFQPICRNKHTYLQDHVGISGYTLGSIYVLIHLFVGPNTCTSEITKSARVDVRHLLVRARFWSRKK